MIEIYDIFLRCIRSEEQLIEFLSYLPESLGGLYPVAVSLFHSNELVRQRVVKLLQTMDSIKVNSGFLSGLNYFLLLGYERLTKTAKPSTAS